MRVAVRFIKDEPHDHEWRQLGCPGDWVSVISHLSDGDNAPAGWTILSSEDLKDHTEKQLAEFRGWYRSVWEPLVESRRRASEEQRRVLWSERQEILQQLANAHDNSNALTGGELPSLVKGLVRLELLRKILEE